MDLNIRRFPDDLHARLLVACPRGTTLRDFVIKTLDKTFAADTESGGIVVSNDEALKQAETVAAHHRGPSPRYMRRSPPPT